MNELMIVLTPKNWIYFKTHQKNIDKAFTDFCETCENVGINIDNLTISELSLRDKENETIEECLV